MGYSPWGREESDMTERLHFHFPLLCIGEGNGSPLQGSCLESPRDVRSESDTTGVTAVLIVAFCQLSGNLGASVHRELTPAAHAGTHLSPASKLERKFWQLRGLVKRTCLYKY